MNKALKNFCLTKVLPKQHFPFHAKSNVHRTKVFAEQNFCLTKLFPVRYLSTGLMVQYSRHHNEETSVLVLRGSIFIVVKSRNIVMKLRLICSKLIVLLTYF